MDKVFTIGKVGWVTKRLPPDVLRAWAVDSFWHLHEFLRKNGLLVRTLANDRADVDSDDFAIRSDDVTVEGLAVMREGYDRWCKALDRGTPPSKMTIMESALVKVRLKSGTSSSAAS